ncbi:hypothetical protein ACFL5F_02560 [Planctomycetota bacterium]
MKQKSKRQHKPSSRSHIAKTPEEKEAYDQKLKLTDSAGGTEDRVSSKTSTLSEKSIYSRSESAGILDRDPIKPPRVSEGCAKWIGIIGGVLTIVALLIGASIWLTTLRNQVVFNEKQIDQLDTNVNEVDSKREHLNMRITKLEQWKNIIDKDLSSIKEDMENAVSNEQIEAKLVKLERRVLDGIRENQKDVNP